MRCKLCNEAFEQVELEFGEVYRVEDEFWHAACYAEYFDEVEVVEKEVEAAEKEIEAIRKN